METSHAVQLEMKIDANEIDGKEKENEMLATEEMIEKKPLDSDMSKYKFEEVESAVKLETEQSHCGKVDSNNADEINQELMAKRLVCPSESCSKEYIKKKSLDEHFRKYHRHEYKYKCNTCGFKCKTRGYLKKHVILVHFPTFPCDICEAVVKTKKALKDHMEESHPKSYPCTICSSVLKHESSLKSHIKKLHEREENYKCDECDKVYTHQKPLELHKLRHGGKKNIICAFCTKTFYSKGEANQHMNLSHINAKKFKCNQCNHTCSTAVRLKRHSIIHMENKERNYSCTFCGSLFYTDDIRKTHEKIHSDDKQFKCDQCPMAFHFPFKLKRHKLIHTGEHDYSCEYCDKKFNQKGNMHTHIKKYHTSIVEEYSPST